MVKRFLLGVAVGAGAVWLLDREHGAERRRRARQLAESAAPVAGWAAQTAVVQGRRLAARVGENDQTS